MARGEAVLIDDRVVAILTEHVVNEESHDRI